VPRNPPDANAPLSMSELDSSEPHIVRNLRDYGEAGSGVSSAQEQAWMYLRMDNIASAADQARLSSAPSLLEGENMNERSKTMILSEKPMTKPTDAKFSISSETKETTVSNNGSNGQPDRSNDGTMIVDDIDHAASSSSARCRSRTRKGPFKDRVVAVVIPPRKRKSKKK
ncbi:hypothetical protein BGZ54_001144, partial [Gamsiella multidivaricata]